MCNPVNLWENSTEPQGIYSSFYANLAPFQCWQKIMFLCLLFAQMMLCGILFYIYRREQKSILESKEGINSVDEEYVSSRDSVNDSRRSINTN